VATRGCRRTADGRSGAIHQFFIGLHRAVVQPGKPLRPNGAVLRGIFQALGERFALVDSQQAFRVAESDRPGRHQQPVDDSEERGGDQEEKHDLGHRRIEFLDAVPFMSGRHMAGMRITLAYRHGLSSSSTMLLAARSKRFLLDGQ
jgi:hypothetical protein